VLSIVKLEAMEVEVWVDIRELGKANVDEEAVGNVEGKVDEVELEELKPGEVVVVGIDGLDFAMLMHDI